MVFCSFGGSRQGFPVRAWQIRSRRQLRTIPGEASLLCVSKHKLVCCRAGAPGVSTTMKCGDCPCLRYTAEGLVCGQEASCRKLLVATSGARRICPRLGAPSYAIRKPEMDEKASNAWYCLAPQQQINKVKRCVPTVPSTSHVSHAMYPPYRPRTHLTCRYQPCCPFQQTKHWRSEDFEDVTS